MLSSEQAVGWAILVCLAGALASLAVYRRKAVAGWVAFVAIAGSAALVVYAIAGVFSTGAGQPVTFLSLPQYGFALRIHVDGLSAVFLGLIACVAVPSALYSIRYMEYYREYSVARYYPNFLIFVAALYGLVCTTDMMYFFFIFWQMMTLTGSALIGFEYRQAANRRAAWKYLGMMQLACVVTMVGAGLLALGGDGGAAPGGGAAMLFDFDAVSRRLPALLQTDYWRVITAFALFLVGFGIKLGMWPFGQIWLPDAHPAAPSPVSALLSGVKIKTGIYGIIRYFLWLVPAADVDQFPHAVWGGLLAGLGAITLFTGTMQALKQEQTKRLLAFHSIGQVGYILLGVGTCLMLIDARQPAVGALAVIGLFGALFHTVNHGLFKSLLFLNAGAFLWSAHTQDLNKLGGLMKYLPATAATCLVASLSIAGVPFFNGFDSKWAIFTAAILGSAYSPMLAVCAVAGMFTSVLTLASFVKFFGASCLCRTSAWVREQVGTSAEVPASMLGPQVFLAAACLALGLAPALAYGLMLRLLAASRQGLGEVLAANAPGLMGPLAGLELPGSRALLAPLLLLAAFVLVLVFVGGLARLGGAPRRAAAPWLCGYALESDRNRYHAHHFYGEIKRWFSRPAKPASRAVASDTLNPLKRTP